MIRSGCVSLGACVVGGWAPRFAIIHAMVGASMNCWEDALFVAVLEGDRDRPRDDEGRLNGGTLDVSASGGGEIGGMFVI